MAVTRTRKSGWTGYNRTFWRAFRGNKAPAWKRRFHPVSQINPSHEAPFAAVVGIDWGDKKHAWSRQPVGSDQRERGEIEHTPEAVESWVSMLSARFHGQLVAVALEQSRGTLIFMLAKYAHLHLYPIHPRAAVQFRAA